MEVGAGGWGGGSAGRGAGLSTEMAPSSITGSPGSLKQRWKLKDRGGSGPGLCREEEVLWRRLAKQAPTHLGQGLDEDTPLHPLFLLRCTGLFSADIRLQFLLRSSVGY